MIFSFPILLKWGLYPVFSPLRTRRGHCLRVLCNSRDSD